MKKLAFSIYIITIFLSSCTKTQVIPVEYTGEPPVVITCTAGDYEITDAAFGEYLIYLNVAGATAKAVQENGQTVTKYYIDTCEVKTRNSLEMLKTSNSRAALVAAGLATADTKMTNLDGIQFFTGLDTLKLTSNSLLVLDLTRNTELVVLEMNFNLVKELDLTQNTRLQTLRFKASANASSNIKIKNIDFSKNLALKHLYLPRHNFETVDLTNNVNLDELIDFTDNPGPNNNTSNPEIVIPAAVYDKVQAAGGTLLGVVRGG